MRTFKRNLLEITKGCRLDMHEPDEQNLTARVVGFKLDNAFGEDIKGEMIEKGFQEIVVILERTFPDGTWRTEKFNLASLIALARVAAFQL
jgi:hypothetical protein